MRRLGLLLGLAARAAGGGGEGAPCTEQPWCGAHPPEDCADAWVLEKVRSAPLRQRRCPRAAPLALTACAARSRPAAATTTGAGAKGSLRSAPHVRAEAARRSRRHNGLTATAIRA